MNATLKRTPEAIQLAMLGLLFDRAEAGGRAVGFLAMHIDRLNDELSAAGIVLRHVAGELDEHEDGAELAGAFRSTLVQLLGWWTEADRRVRAIRCGTFASVPVLAGDEFVMAMEARSAAKVGAREGAKAAE